MDNSFTEHVLERARLRQKKLAPLREANGVSVSSSSPNLTQSEILRARKEIVSDSVLLTTPKLTKSNSKTKISSNISSSPSQEFNTLNIQKDSLNMEIRFSSAENVRVEVEIQSDDESGSPKAIVYGNTDHMTSVSTPVKASVTEVSDENGDSEEEESEKAEDLPVLREEAKTRLQRLGKLYSGSEELSSPINRTEGKFRIDEHNERNEEVKENSRPKRGLGKLAELANDINQWEDDISSSRKNMQDRKVTTPKKWKPPAPQPPQKESPKKTHGKPPAPKPPVVMATSLKKKSDEEKPESKAKSAGKQLKWDKSVLDTLDKEKVDAITENEEHEEKPEQKEVVEKVKPKIAKKFEQLPARKEENLVTPRSPVKARGIASRAALFEQSAPASPKKEKDPALLSVSQRMALFEKNAGEALVPKAAFGMAAPISKIQPSTSTSSELNKKVESPVPSKKLKESGSIAEKIALLNQGANTATIAQRQIEEQVKEDRQREMDVLLNRFNKNRKVAVKAIDAIETDSESDEEVDDDASETTAMISSKAAAKVVRKSSDMPPPPPPPGESRKSGEKRPKSGDSIQVQAVLGEVKRIKVTQPKDGKLYPCLSDIEANTASEPEVSTTPNNSSFDESYESEGGANTSLGREVMQAMYARHPPQLELQKRVSDCSTESSVSDVTECLNDIDSEDSIGPPPSKHGKLHSPQKTHVSQSFSYKKFSPQKSPSKFRSPCKIVTSPRRDSGANLPTHVVDGSDVLPLTYTVSFYRKQQTQGSTPLRQVKRAQDEAEEDIIEECNDESIEVAEKIEQLTREVNKQQLVISQASSALNLCISTPEFTGSTEQVEAERLLLLASHRRQAATLEIQRLKIEKSLRPLAQHAQNLPIEKGTLIISNISLPLKKEYTKALAAAGGKGHHVVCLVKCGEQIAETQLVSTVAGSSKHLEVELVIPGQVKLSNVYSDFTVTLEVYCLQAQEEILSHEVKYHIGKKGSSKLTPRKNKENRMLRPPKESPAGPHAVRSSSFALNGYIIFSIQAINKTQWTLNQTPPISPLEGSVNMRVHCELNVSVEHRGFLNMFEDVSGLGAWHRRWCLLKGSLISYWRYPEDERKKAPIDTIDLRSCITRSVGPVSREICARLHTFLLERERPTQAGDRETLTVSCQAHKTIIKHLLSADTKDERIEWTANLNKSLNALRMCGGGIKSTDF